MSTNQPQGWTGSASTLHPSELLRAPGSKRSFTPAQIAASEDEEHLDDFGALYRAALEGVSTRRRSMVTDQGHWSAGPQRQDI